MSNNSYEEISLGLPNVFGRRMISESAKTLSINPHISPFVTALAIKKPDWKILGFSPFRHRENLEFNRFKVMSNREAIGEISTEWRSGNYVYACTNERIRSSLQRGFVIRSKDLKKAVKVATTFFRTKNADEQISEASAAVAQLIGNKAASDFAGYEACFKRITHALRSYIVNNFDSLKQIAVQGGASLDDTAKLLPLYEQAAITTAMQGWVSTGKGSIVLIRGDEYFIQERSESPGKHLILTSDGLPPHIKRAVGMLKLLDDGKILSHVGVKLNASAFFIGPEVAHE